MACEFAHCVHLRYLLQLVIALAMAAARPAKALYEMAMSGLILLVWCAASLALVRAAKAKCIGVEVLDIGRIVTVLTRRCWANGSTEESAWHLYFVFAMARVDLLRDCGRAGARSFRPRC